MNRPSNESSVTGHGATSLSKLATRRTSPRKPKPKPRRQTKTLAARVELLGAPLRAAVRELSETISPGAERAWREAFSPRISVQDENFGPERVARVLALVWMTSARFGEFTSMPTLSEAEGWFRGDAVPATVPWLSETWNAEDAGTLTKLHSMSLDEQTAELLPYLLEPHQRGSRLSVRRDASQLVDRREKKASGVFYTPVDVAEHMCSTAIAANHARSPLCLDPACGTGVFLRCLLRKLAKSKGQNRLEVATSRLFGFDLDGAALDAAAFVLLWECLSLDSNSVPNAWATWHRIRMNLMQVDALTITPVGGADKPRRSALQSRQEIKKTLEAEKYLPARMLATISSGPAATLFGGGWGHRVDHLFPEASKGFNLYVANPPYSPLGERDDAAELKSRFACADGKALSGRENIYTFFIEQMWKLTGTQGSGAVVVPLSIAFHRGERYRAIRRAMSQQERAWKCEFYDREPHALFGEDVKTRNAIIAMVPGTKQLSTGPFHRWTSRTRATLFDAPRRVLLHDEYEDGIPKLADLSELSAYQKLQSVRGFGGLVTRVHTTSLSNATESNCNKSIHIASTAYNFLSVFPYVPQIEGVEPLSENPVQKIICVDERAAMAVYACLSSQVAFWTWYVRGDGFHVPKWFIDEFPAIDGLSSSDVDALSLIGQSLWDRVRRRPIISHNRGRFTPAFPQLAYGDLREQADVLLLKAVGVPSDFSKQLTRFLHDLVVLDPDDAARAKLAEAFAETATHG